jgi:hypothetical protein
MDSGNLPRIAEGLAGHGIPVTRFTYKSSSLPARVKVFQVMTLDLGVKAHLDVWMYVEVLMSLKMAYHICS